VNALFDLTVPTRYVLVQTVVDPIVPTRYVKAVFDPITVSESLYFVPVLVY
jgi:hypothetical protein